jgi:hypothetical protein
MSNCIPEEARNQSITESDDMETKSDIIEANDESFLIYR